MDERITGGEEVVLVWPLLGMKCLPYLYEITG
jgi:hypothetical protein